MSNPTLVSGPDNLPTAEVLATQTAMDTELADRHQPPQPATLTELARLLPRLAPPHPEDLAAARRLDPSALASRVADASSQLLHLPPSLLVLQPPALAAQRAAHHHTQAAATRHQQLTHHLHRQGRLRGWLQPQRALRLRQQLRAVEQDQQRAGQQLQAARLRLRAIELRQDQRRQFLRCYRLPLREGAAAALVLAERDLVRHHDREASRPHPTRQPPTPTPTRHRPDPEFVGDGPERS